MERQWQKYMRDEPEEWPWLDVTIAPNTTNLEVFLNVPPAVVIDTATASLVAKAASTFEGSGNLLYINWPCNFDREGKLKSSPAPPVNVELDEYKRELENSTTEVISEHEERSSDSKRPAEDEVGGSMSKRPRIDNVASPAVQRLLDHVDESNKAWKERPGMQAELKGLQNRLVASEEELAAKKSKNTEYEAQITRQENQIKANELALEKSDTNNQQIKEYFNKRLKQQEAQFKAKENELEQSQIDNQARVAELDKRVKEVEKELATVQDENMKLSEELSGELHKGLRNTHTISTLQKSVRRVEREREEAYSQSQVFWNALEAVWILYRDIVLRCAPLTDSQSERGSDIDNDGPAKTGTDEETTVLSRSSLIEAFREKLWVGTVAPSIHLDKATFIVEAVQKGETPKWNPPRLNAENQESGLMADIVPENEPQSSSQTISSWLMEHLTAVESHLPKTINNIQVTKDTMTLFYPLQVWKEDDWLAVVKLLAGEKGERIGGVGVVLFGKRIFRVSKSHKANITRMTLDGRDQVVAIREDWDGERNSLTVFRPSRKDAGKFASKDILLPKEYLPAYKHEIVYEIQDTECYLLTLAVKALFGIDAQVAPCIHRLLQRISEPESFPAGDPGTVTGFDTGEAFTYARHA
ncbi:hypothetical protein CC80DRAFT_543157 [Byssothecium circinans]|uniref:Uncharacterized protein n=1 Tax=Byssothecium circinans TaxID=147558 RepID=A0A6A5UBU1_9PLEO|nr:hypothetical protein CC80DRAFT_543157 [Byssothecium circinans]